MVNYQIFDKGKLEKNNEYINYPHRITLSFTMSLHEAQEAFLKEHNRLRALHQDTEPLELSDDLCNEAQVY